MSERPVVNAFTVALEPDEDEVPGYRPRMVRAGPLLAAEALGASVYELDPGESICPYHYEHGNEEWLLVLSGHPAVRHPEGEDTLDPGDLVCFPEGPEGGHKLTARGEEKIRLVIFSTVHDPAVVVYPDSGKVGVWPPGKLFREADAVDYWEGER